MKWMLDNVPAVKEAAACDRLAFGNIDSWLIWKLTNGAIHATDASNACRTMLFNIHEHKWDTDLIEMFDIPKSALPEVKDSNGDFGIYQNGSLQIPIRAVLGDQQSALFGQLCWNEGEIKNTYGTGCFMLMNTGSEVAENANLLASVAWCKSSEVTYCLEGSVFIAGAAMQWLRDELMIIDNIENSHHIASSAVDKDLVVVPAFAGLGAPHWDMDARGAIFGLTRDINRQDIIKATLESIAFQSADLLEEMKLGDHGIGKVRVDGGAAANDYLMQFQSDLMQIEIERPKNIESTAMGVAYMAGMAVGLWTENQLSLLRAVDENYTPKRSQAEVQKIKSAWLRAVNALKSWSENG
jgi:glycerol kinase